MRVHSTVESVHFLLLTKLKMLWLSIKLRRKQRLVRESKGYEVDFESCWRETNVYADSEERKKTKQGRSFSVSDQNMDEKITSFRLEA